jgi:hypothetical protein
MEPLTLCKHANNEKIFYFSLFVLIISEHFGSLKIFSIFAFLNDARLPYLLTKHIVYIERDETLKKGFTIIIPCFEGVKGDVKSKFEILFMSSFHSYIFFFISSHHRFQKAAEEMSFRFYIIIHPFIHTYVCTMLLCYIYDIEILQKMYRNV